MDIQLGNIKDQSPAQMLLGADVFIVNRLQAKVNRFIDVQTDVVNYPEERLPVQFGRYICAPNRETTLYYLKHHFTSHSSAQVVRIHIGAGFFDLWEERFFAADESINEQFPGARLAFCAETQRLLSELTEAAEQENMEQSLRQLECVLQLLRVALRALRNVDDIFSVPACSFLNNTGEREKVLAAREILDEEFEQALSIKELSRRVAINECYLKKGFKAMFGKTVNEYRQFLRIEKAKQLLQNEGKSVSAVADILGYSSISHFSSAFKKATNLKPCELLK